MLLPRPEEVLPRILRVGEEYEFATFLIGVRLPERLPAPERSRMSRPLKEALGRALETRHWPERAVCFESPQLQLVIEAATGRVEVIAAPLFVAGRYRKYSRRISSTHWRHLGCRGRGCPKCGFKGHLAEGSVGELIGRPLMAAARGTSYSFHGMGREDVDARMLGTGRPFVVEIAGPRRRSLDLGALAAEIAAGGRGLVDVAGPLALVAAKAVCAIKETGSEKSYSALVVTAGPLPADAARRMASLSGCAVSQLTPTRVRHRRARKVRLRKVLSSFATVLDSRSFVWQVRASAGTYIKELASGDGGNTTPSVSEALGAPAVVCDLDVIAVHCRAPWE